MAEKRDPLDLEGLTMPDIQHGHYTAEELAEFAREITETRNIPVMDAMAATWGGRMDITMGYGSRIKDEQYKILEYIFGPGKKLDLQNAIYARHEKDPEIGQKLIEYAKLHGFIEELPDELKEGLL